MEKYVKNMGRGHECRTDSFHMYKDRTGRDTMYPYDPRKPDEDWGQTDSAVDEELTKLHTRIKFLEDNATTHIDIIEATGGGLHDLPSRKKDVNRLWKKSNAVSSRLEKALEEIDSLRSRCGGDNEAETMQELEERVDSLTEEVSSLRTSQQDHRRAIYDWSSKIDTSKRTTEEQIKDAVRRIQSLEQQNSSEGTNANQTQSTSCARIEVGTTEETSSMPSPRRPGSRRAARAALDPTNPFGPGSLLERARGRDRRAGI